MARPCDPSSSIARTMPGRWAEFPQFPGSPYLPVGELLGGTTSLTLGTLASQTDYLETWTQSTALRADRWSASLQGTIRQGSLCGSLCNLWQAVGLQHAGPLEQGTAPALVVLP